MKKYLTLLFDRPAHTHLPLNSVAWKKKKKTVPKCAVACSSGAEAND